MKSQANDRSFQQVVPADKAATEGLPGVAQRAVPAESCDLRARYERIESMMATLARTIRDIRDVHGELVVEWVELSAELKARKTHVGGNAVINDCEENEHGKH